MENFSRIYAEPEQPFQGIWEIPKENLIPPKLGLNGNHKILCFSDLNVV
jgi:hypothetical protein